MLYQCEVEINAGHDSGVLTNARERKIDAAAGRRHNDDLAYRRRSGKCVERKAEGLKNAQPAGGETVATGLVSGERRPVDHHNTSAGPRRGNCRGAARGPGADDQKVAVMHGWHQVHSISLRDVRIPRLGRICSMRNLSISPRCRWGLRHSLGPRFDIGSAPRSESRPHSEGLPTTVASPTCLWERTE